MDRYYVFIRGTSGLYLYLSTHSLTFTKVYIKIKMLYYYEKIFFIGIKPEFQKDKKMQAVKLCFIFNSNNAKYLQMCQIYGLSQKYPDFSKIMSGILNPSIPTFWNSGWSCHRQTLAIIFSSYFPFPLYLWNAGVEFQTWLCFIKLQVKMFTFLTFLRFWAHRFCCRMCK